jgi:hypothetical protein
MSTNKKFFMSIDIMDAKYLHGIIMDEYKSGPIIDISININDYKLLSLSDIIQDNIDIELSYYKIIYKYANSYLLYGNSVAMDLYYDEYNISHINNLLIIFNFVINKLFKKIINKIYSLIDDHNYILIINDIKKFNCMRLYKSLYYMGRAIY